MSPAMARPRDLNYLTWVGEIRDNSDLFAFYRLTLSPSFLGSCVVTLSSSSC